jgi:tetratricopeptide (TPR) repeat protein
MRNRIYGLLGALFLVLSLPAAAAESTAGFKLQQLIQLVEAGRSAEAYDYLKPYILANEGEAAFDFWYGLAAIDSGHTSEGVFALERAVLSNPSDDRARLELARGYFQLEEDVRARQEFQVVLAHNPPPKVRANIKLFLDQIRLRESQYKTTALAYVEFGFGYDSNINGAPSDSTFNSPLLGNLTLANASLEQGDRFAELLAGGQLTHPFAPGRQLQFGFNAASRRHLHERVFETEQLNAFAAVSIREGDDRYRVTGQIQEYEVDSVDNRTLFGIGLDWQRRLDDRTRINLAGQVAQLRYPEQLIRDSTLYGLSAGAEYNITPTVIGYGSLLLGHEDSHSNTDEARALADRKYYGLNAGVQWRYSARTTLGASALYQSSRYAARNVLLGATRVDDFATVGLTGRWLLSDHWSINASASYTYNNSSLAINEYERELYRMGIRYEF